MRYRKQYVISIFILLLLSLHSFGQGLLFQKSVHAINQRTSYEVFKSGVHTFHHNLTVSFDMQLPYTDDVGYILRIMDTKSKKTFNVFFDGRGNDYFELNDEGHKELITYRFNRKELYNKHWFRFILNFNLDTKTISMSINGHNNSVKMANLADKFAPKIVFGRSDYLIEVPSFEMRNLVIHGNDNTYRFPLNQANGNDVYDDNGEKIGYVQNPYWGINDTFHWKFLNQLSSKTNAGVYYDMLSQSVYYYNRDMLYSCNVNTRDVTSKTFTNECPVNINLGMNFFNPSNGKLYTYEAYKDDKKPTDVTVASLDLKTMTWKPESYDQLTTQRHHHGAFFDAATGQFTIYGGFGSMRYSNDFCTYDLGTHKWTVRNDITGMKLHRYFVSVGHYGDNIYLFGGMGNESGNQTVGREYLYDCYRLDLKTKKVSKLWNLDWKENDNIVPVRNMIIANDKYFYVMCYSEFMSNSYLKLYRFSLKDGKHEILGDSIPIHSDEIATNANMFYDKYQQKIIVTVQEFKKDMSSTLNIYSIQMPVLSKAQYAEISQKPNNDTFIIIIVTASILILIIAAMLFYKYKIKAKTDIILSSKIDTNHSIPNSIYLFGAFTARDKKNHDISHLFTNKLHELICVLIKYSMDEGISSKDLGEMLWRDKPKDKIKDSRNVAINNLRKALSDIEGIELVHTEGVFKLNTAPPFTCDYYDYARLIEQRDDVSVIDLLKILKRGPFLKGLEMATLDDFKSDYEDKITPILTRQMERAYAGRDYKLTIELAQVLFYVDSFNAKALEYQIKSLKKIGKMDEAKTAVNQFNKEYKKVLDDDE